MKIKDHTASFLAGMFNGIALVGAPVAAIAAMGLGLGPLEAGAAALAVFGGGLLATHFSARAAGEYQQRTSTAGVIMGGLAVVAATMPFFT